MLLSVIVLHSKHVAYRLGVTFIWNQALILGELHFAWVAWVARAILSVVVVPPLACVVNPPPAFVAAAFCFRFLLAFPRWSSHWSVNLYLIVIPPTTNNYGLITHPMVCNKPIGLTHATPNTSASAPPTAQDTAAHQSPHYVSSTTPPHPDD